MTQTLTYGGDDVKDKRSVFAAEQRVLELEQRRKDAQMEFGAASARVFSRTLLRFHG